MQKILLVLSGGQDSVTCGWWAKERGFEIHAVTFDYGQRHSREIRCATLTAELLGVASHEVVAIPDCLRGTSPLVSCSQLEQYEDFNSLPGGLEKTFVPARNLLFLTLAANRAYCLGINQILTGVCQEDYGGYPDCRRAFITAVELALNEGLFNADAGFPMGAYILTPLMYLTKAKTVEMALDLGPDAYASLAWTHTGYDGAWPPTGHDHATLLRAKGFAGANTPDPMIVRAWYDELMPLPETSNYDAVRATKSANSFVQFIHRVYNELRPF